MLEFITKAEKQRINRARKKLNESKETRYDIALKNALANFRVIDFDMCKKITKYDNKSISDNRINLYLKADFIRKDTITINNQVKEVLFVTDYGKRQIKKLTSKCKDTTYTSRSIEHDYCQANYIINQQTEFSIEDIRRYYKSETELDKATGSDESRTDGAFIFDDGRQNVYIETVTQHYKDNMKLAKQNYAKNKGGRYIEYKVTI